MHNTLPRCPRSVLRHFPLERHLKLSMDRLAKLLLQDNKNITASPNFERFVVRTTYYNLLILEHLNTTHSVRVTDHCHLQTMEILEWSESIKSWQYVNTLHPMEDQVGVISRSQTLMVVSVLPLTRRFPSKWRQRTFNYNKMFTVYLHLMNSSWNNILSS